MNVLISGASNAVAIVIARILHYSGHAAIMADSEHFSRAFYSRYCTRKYRFRNPAIDLAGYADDLAGCIAKEKIGLVVPTTDQALLDLIAVKELIPRHVVVPLPLDHDKIDCVADKGNLVDICSAAGVATPVMRKLSPFGAIPDIDALTPPYALKRARGTAGKGFLKVDSRHHLPRAVGKLRKEFPGEAFLLQEHVDGKVYGAGGVFADGVLNNFYCYRYVRRFPALSGGATVCMLEPLVTIKAAMQKVLAVLSWDGYCQMDFIIDEQTGEPYLIDINPVHWYAMPFSSTMDESCLVHFLDKGGGRRQVIADVPYGTLGFLREFLRLMSVDALVNCTLYGVKEYWITLAHVRRVDYFCDPLPIVMAPFLKMLRLLKKG